ncbi:hypothetical protein PC116_g16321 [Phytophthora cactorum]|nr:hypothetical protein PC116_g16321 [Phytophthora cactorum]
MVASAFPDDAVAQQPMPDLVALEKIEEEERKEREARAAKDAANAEPVEVTGEKIAKLDSLLEKASLYSSFLFSNMESAATVSDVVKEEEEELTKGKRKRGTKASQEPNKKTKKGVDKLRENNLTELWSLLNFILPDVFDDLKLFESWFSFTPDAVATAAAAGESVAAQDVLQGEKKVEVIAKLHEILRPFLLRRLKVDVVEEMVSKTEIFVYCSMTPMQREYYQMIRNGTLSKAMEEKHGKFQAQKAIGQKNEIIVYRLVTENSFEDRMTQRAFEKRKLERVVIQRGGFKQRTTPAEDAKLTNSELEELLRDDVEIRKGVESGGITDEELNQILDRELVVKSFVKHTKDENAKASDVIPFKGGGYEVVDNAPASMESFA